MKEVSQSLLIALILLHTTSAVATAPLVAEQITAANAAKHVQQGLDAAGGIGDWVLSNGTLCAIVSDVDHESDLSASGGALIDLGYCDRADDQFVVTQDLMDGSLAAPVNMHRVYASMGTDRAAIVSLGGEGGLVHQTRISVDLAHPNQIMISKRVHRRNEAAPNFRLLVPILFNYHSMETFLLSSTEPQRSTGFSQVGFSAQGLGAFTAAARNLDTIVALGAPQSEVPIAYGWQLRSAKKVAADGKATTLPRFALSDASASVFLVLSDSFFIGDQSDLGMTQMLQVALMDLEVGEQLQIEETIYVGRSSDVASITDQLYATASLRSGHVNNAAAVIQIDIATSPQDWAPFSFVRPNTSGHYQLRLPSGRFRLTANAAADSRISKIVTLDADAPQLPDLNLPAAAVVELPRGMPMRLVFKGLNGTPDPDLQNTLTGFEVKVDDVLLPQPPVPMVFLAGIDSDRSEVSLTPGDYRVYATRGIEFNLTHTDISVAAGQRQVLNIAAPQRAVTTPGYIAADLHVHSGPSMDNGFSTRERVRTFVAEHGEVMVATEHETLFDFTPLISSMGLATEIATVTGTEMTGQVRTPRMPHTAGHANFFPLEPDPMAFRRGVPANEDRRLREVLFEVKRKAPTVLAQLNHTRGDDKFLQAIPDEPAEMIDDGAYFDHMGPAAYPYDPSQPLTSKPNRTLIEPDPTSGLRDIDFDAMEILNGAHDYAPTRRRALMADWQSLLLQGERITGTANSDSHGKRQQVALPRTMVAMADDNVANFAQAPFVEAIRAGQTYGTTGPLLSVELSGTGIGGTFKGTTGVLSGHIMSADWVPVEELRVLVNGEVLVTQPVVSNGSFSIPLTFQADSFVLIEVEAQSTQPYQTIFPGHRPYAFSNPIYVDADGDGRWQPPGLNVSANR